MSEEGQDREVAAAGVSVQRAFDLVALDLDGTVLSRDLTISGATVDALSALRERGVRVAVATGRRFKGALPHVQRLGFASADPIACYGGAMVRRLDGETLLHRTIALEAAAAALRWAEERGIHSRVFMDGEVIASRETPAALSHLRVFREQDVSVVNSIVPWLLSREREPTKIVLVDYPEEIEHWLREAQAYFAETLFVTRSLPHYVEIGSLEGKKSHALRFLCDLWGVDPGRTIAFGDADNDMDMLRFAGRGVAMGDASPEVKAAADDIAPSIHEDGVARYINSLLGL